MKQNLQKFNCRFVQLALFSFSVHSELNLVSQRMTRGDRVFFIYFETNKILNFGATMSSSVPYRSLTLTTELHKILLFSVCYPKYSAFTSSQERLRAHCYPTFNCSTGVRAKLQNTKKRFVGQYKFGGRNEYSFLFSSMKILNCFKTFCFWNLHM